MSVTQEPTPAESNPLEPTSQTTLEFEEDRERLLTILAATPDMVSFSDLHGRELYINPAGRRMLGLGEDEDVTQRFVPDDHPEWAASLVLREGIPTALREGVWRGESAIRGPGGREIPVSQIVLCHRARDGRPDFFSTVAVDVSALKRAEGIQQLLDEATIAFGASLEYESTLRNLVRFVVPRIADGCWVTMLDEDGRIEDVAAAHANATKEQHLLALLHRRRPLDARPVGLHKVLRSGELELVGEVTEYWLRAAMRGAERPHLYREMGAASVLTAPLCARGRTFGAITFVQGESGRRFTREDVAFTQELGRRAALALDNARLYQAAQQAIRARDDVLGIVAHDLRAPLNTISMSASLLLRAQPAEEQATRNLELIKRSTSQMDHLIQDLLDVTRLEAGSLGLERRSEEVASIIGEARESFLPVAQQKQLRLECEVEDDVPRSWPTVRESSRSSAISWETPASSRPREDESS